MTRIIGSDILAGDLMLEEGVLLAVVAIRVAGLVAGLVCHFPFSQVCTFRYLRKRLP